MTPADLKVTHHFIDLPSLRMHYVEAGRGPLVVLLHGFPECWWSWRYQLSALADAGFRVVAPDLRGYGETDKRGPFDLDTLVGDVCHLVEALGERQAKIVGHDWGGAVAWHLASHRAPVCERLAVLNCPHPLQMRKAILSRPSWAQLKKSWYFFFFQLPVIPEWVLTKDDAGNLVRMLASASVDRSHFSPEELRPLRDAIQRPGAATGMVNWYRHAVRSSFARPFTPPAYPPISCETLLVWGMQDPALGFHELVPGTEAYAPKLRVEQIQGCGHFVQSERPADVNRALTDFLRAAPASA